jgi:transcriptional regulator with XRE-family HTH domain
VSSWESGRSEPGPEFRPRLAEVLQLRGLFSTWWESGDCSGPSPSEAIAREIEREAEGLSESYRARLLDIARRVRGLG